MCEAVSNCIKKYRLSFYCLATLLVMTASSVLPKRPIYCFGVENFLKNEKKQTAEERLKNSEKSIRLKKTYVVTWIGSVEQRILTMIMKTMNLLGNVSLGFTTYSRQGGACNNFHLSLFDGSFLTKVRG